MADKLEFQAKFEIHSSNNNKICRTLDMTGVLCRTPLHIALLKLKNWHDHTVVKYASTKVHMTGNLSVVRIFILKSKTRESNRKPYSPYNSMRKW